MKHFLSWRRRGIRYVVLSSICALLKNDRIPSERFGSDYGGWVVCPVGLNEETIVYSVGIGEDISFDLAMIEKFGCQVFAFDPTPRSIAWLKSQKLPEEFNWFDYGIADYDGEAAFYPPENPDHVSHTMLLKPERSGEPFIGEVRRIGTLLKELRHSHINILKMDIEGAEYDVIKDMIKTNIKPDQVLVEFHHFFENISIFKTFCALCSLYLRGYKIFHISENGNEYSFAHRKYIKKIIGT